MLLFSKGEIEHLKKINEFRSSLTLEQYTQLLNTHLKQECIKDECKLCELEREERKLFGLDIGTGE